MLCRQRFPVSNLSTGACSGERCHGKQRQSAGDAVIDYIDTSDGCVIAVANNENRTAIVVPGTPATSKRTNAISDQGEGVIAEKYV